MTRATRLLPVLLAALVLAGCSTSGNTPDSYPERPDDIDAPAPEGVDRNNFAVWENYRDACLEANADLDDQTAQDICTCTWDAYVEQVPFEVFVEFDRTIRERIGDIGDNRASVEQIAANVVAEYNRDLDDDEEPLEVDLIEMMESCQPQAA